MEFVKIGGDGLITLPRAILEAARLEEGDYLEAEVTPSGAIMLRPVLSLGQEPTSEQAVEILAAVDSARALNAEKRRR